MTGDTAKTTIKKVSRKKKTTKPVKEKKPRKVTVKIVKVKVPKVKKVGKANTKGLAALEAYRKSGKKAKRSKKIDSVFFPFGAVKIMDGHPSKKSYFAANRIGTELIYHMYSKKSAGYKTKKLISGGVETKSFTKGRRERVLKKGAVFI